MVIIKRILIIVGIVIAISADHLGVSAGGVAIAAIGVFLLNGEK